MTEHDLDGWLKLADELQASYERTTHEAGRQWTHNGLDAVWVVNITNAETRHYDTFIAISNVQGVYGGNRVADVLERYANGAFIAQAHTECPAMVEAIRKMVSEIKLLWIILSDKIADDRKLAEGRRRGMQECMNLFLELAHRKDMTPDDAGLLFYEMLKEEGITGKPLPERKTVSGEPQSLGEYLEVVEPSSTKRR